MPLTKSPFHLAILYLPKYLGIKVEGSNPCLSNSKFSNHPFSQVSNRCLPTLTKSSSNKIFITTSVPVYGRGHFTIYRDSTNLGNTNGFAINDDDMPNQIEMSVLDSPSTTSAITYQVYFKKNNTETQIITSSLKATITCFEIAG